MSGRDQNPFGLPDSYTPSPMPASMPTMVFMHGGNTTYHQLRGGPVFEVMRASGYKVELPDEHGVMRVPASGPLMVLMDLQLDAVDWVENLRERWGSVVLVDVTGPIWDTDRLIALDPGAHAYWADPGNQRAAQRLLRAADGVTTPSPGYTGLLMDFNDQVFVLPDLDEERDESAVDFMVKLNVAWHTAMEAKVARLREATTAV